MAVGARRGEIERRLVKDGLRLGVLGLGIGLLVSVLGLRVLDSEVGDISISLPPAAAIAALGVLVVATAAAWIPARRAASVNPAVALRGE